MQMRWMRWLALVATVVLVGMTTGPVTARPDAGPLMARPRSIDFKNNQVGTESYKQTRITNISSSDIRFFVDSRLPDDFGFGLLPGQTCPVFDPGEILAAGASCYAVVRFSPTESFIGWQAVGSLIAMPADPLTGAPLAELSVPVLGMAVPQRP